MSSKIDLVGEKFGRLLVLKDSGKRKNSKDVIWKCRCDCGNEHFANTSYLKDGRTNSCGCLRRDKMKMQKFALLENNQAAFNKLYGNYRNHANTRDLDFDLSKDEFKVLSQGNCYYCGKEPIQIISSTTGSYIYNGVDRVNNLLGYTLDNCVPCCGECNRLKRNITIDLCLKVVEFIKEREE